MEVLVARVLKRGRPKKFWNSFFHWFYLKNFNKIIFFLPPYQPKIFSFERGNKVYILFGPMEIDYEKAFWRPIPPQSSGQDVATPHFPCFWDGGRGDWISAVGVILDCFTSELFYVWGPKASWLQCNLWTPHPPRGNWLWTGLMMPHPLSVTWPRCGDSAPPVFPRWRTRWLNKWCRRDIGLFHVKIPQLVGACGLCTPFLL